MSTPSAIEKFEELVDAAEALVDDLERDRGPEFEAVLSHVLAHLKERGQFSRRFIEILRSSTTDGDLFEYCMLELRWPEVERQVHAMMIDAEKAGNRRLQF